VRGLTFELTGARRQDALARTQTMYRVPAAGPRWPAVARPVERMVRHRCTAVENLYPSTNQLCVIRASGGRRLRAAPLLADCGVLHHAELG
jgi:hypothetical protein